MKKVIIFLKKSGEGQRGGIGGKKGEGKTFNSVVFSKVKLKIKENSKTVQKKYTTSKTRQMLIPYRNMRLQHTDRHAYTKISEYSAHV